jgi:8-oxo-dGTP diphosphatase
VVVWKGGKVLLVRRGKPPRDGQWSIPGGAQELGETLAETARREVREEAAIEIDVTELIDVVDFIECDEHGGVRYHYSLIDWSGEWRAGELRAGGDVSEVMWADPADLDRFDIWSETQRIILESAEARQVGTRT